MGSNLSNLEVIFVDDGSTDNTVAIIARDNSDRINIYSQPNSESVYAINLGVEKAPGVWIAFIDSDDIWSIDKVQSN